jgi:hypothetical protein
MIKFSQSFAKVGLDFAEFRIRKIWTSQFLGHSTPKPCGKFVEFRDIGKEKICKVITGRQG